MDFDTTSLTPSISNNRAHRAAGDDAGTFRGGAHDHAAGAVPPLDVVVQGSALAQRDADDVAFGGFAGFADRLGDFLGFTFAETDAALLIADHHEGCETEAFAAFDGFGYPVDRHQTISEFRCFVAVATAPATLFSCHVYRSPKTSVHLHGQRQRAL